MTKALKNQLARALADYDNLKKRTEAEKAVWQKFAKGELLVKLLPILDTLEVAQKHLKDRGLELALGQFIQILKEEGIEVVETEKFNEELHEVVEAIPTSAEASAGQVAEVLTKGYKFSDGGVIRHAKVKVYK